ncbi:MAG: peptidase S9 [Actinobacteria bacterium]|nr:peptidase S9 [Actinomycetota bacterium]
MTLDHATKSRLEFAGVGALTVLTWYALPDVLHSRPGRALVKAVLLGVTAAGAGTIPQVYPMAREPSPARAGGAARPAPAGRAVAAAALGTLLTVWFEKVVFAAGERRRTDGARCAHTRAAAEIALLTGAAALIDWTGASRADS